MAPQEDILYKTSGINKLRKETVRPKTAPALPFSDAHFLMMSSKSTF